MEGRRKILIADHYDYDIHDLRKDLIAEGYEVRIAKTAGDVIPYVESFRPDLVLIEPRLPDFDPAEMLPRLREAAAPKMIPIVFASHPRSIDERLSWLELDVDDFLYKPYEVEEVLARLEILIKEAQSVQDATQMSTPGFSGSLSEMALVDLLQTLEVGKKTAVLSLQKGGREGRVYVTQGEVVDAELDHLDARTALLRMFTWNEGQFSVSMMEHDRTRSIFVDTPDLISEGVTRLYRWEQLSKDLPSLQSVVLKAPDKTDVQLTRDEQHIMELIDGRKRMIDIIEQSKFDDIKALRLFKGLFEKGAVMEAPLQNMVMTPEYLEKFKVFPENGNSRVQVMEGVFSALFRKPQTVTLQNDRRRVERRRGERRKYDRRRGYGPLPHRICLNRSELLLIREKLLSGVKHQNSSEKTSGQESPVVSEAVHANR